MLFFLAANTNQKTESENQYQTTKAQKSGIHNRRECHLALNKCRRISIEAISNTVLCNHIQKHDLI